MLPSARPILAVAFLTLVGCRPTPLEWPVEPSPPATEAGTAFDPTRCGTITGRVTWVGEPPVVPCLDAVLSTGGVPNPHSPRIDSTTRGFAGAVVFLRDIDPAVGRKWNLPPTRIEIAETGIQIVPENGSPSSIGFAQRGAEVAMQSVGSKHRMLRARGAAFFTLAFPEPGQPLNRRFDRPGFVNLTGASGEFGASAGLFVCDHPYYAMTAADGSFALPQVPAGEWELVIWARNWHITGKDRDPETGLVTRVRYAEPIQKSTTVRVVESTSATANLAISITDFPAR